MMLGCSNVIWAQHHINMNLVLGEEGTNGVDLGQPFGFDFELIVGEEEEFGGSFQIPPAVGEGFLGVNFQGEEANSRVVKVKGFEIRVILLFSIIH